MFRANGRASARFDRYGDETLTEGDLAWLRENFDRSRTWLQAALDRDIETHTIDDVWHDIETGGAQLWPCPDAAIVTYIEEHPRTKLLRVWLAGGDLSQIVGSEDAICSWGKRMGCAWVKFEGHRSGWVRVIKDAHDIQRVFVKRL